MSQDERRREFWFAGLVMLTAGLFFAAAVLAGRKLLISGYFWPPDVLFGFDINRNIQDLTEFGHAGRSNVHPLFAPVFKPLGLAVRHLGITAGIAAIVVNAAAGALGLMLTAAYLRMREVKRTEAFLLVALTACSATWIFQSAMPGTYIFSFCVIIATHMLLIRSLRRPDGEQSVGWRLAREACWLATGILNYGITVTNGMLSFIAYGFAHRGTRGWARAVVYGATVLAGGLAATWLVGGLFNIFAERQFLFGYTPEAHGWVRPLLHSASTFLVWGFVAPQPTLGVTLDARHWNLLTFHHWSYTSFGWLLAIGWIVLLVAGARAAWKDRDPQSRRMSQALAVSLGFLILLHVVYYVSFEGVFVWSSHSIFFVIALLAPLMRNAGAWPRGRRITLIVALAALAIILAARHFGLLLDLPNRVPLPPGFS